MTDWSPDICGCTIRAPELNPDEDWSDFHGHKAVTGALELKTCSRHKNLKGDTLLKQVHYECCRKNDLLHHIANNYPAGILDNQSAQQKVLSAAIVPQNPTSALMQTTTIADPNTPITIAGIISFDTNHKLIFQSSGLQLADIQAIQIYCDTTFGVGKVTVS